MEDEVLIKRAGLFDVHKRSEFPEVKAVVDSIFEEIKECRALKGKQIRKADNVKNSLYVVVIDLWAASKLSFSPYRVISKNKSDFQGESRYKKIFLTYDYFIGVISDLIELNYIEQKLGFYDRRVGGSSRRTRIKATDKLINKILQPEYGLINKVEMLGAISLIATESNQELIVLKDKDKALQDYEDNNFTNGIRENLKPINEKIRNSQITLNINDEQYSQLMQRIKEDEEYRIQIDFTKVELHRVFNNSSWQEGGRFYGGWWQNIPKAFRKYIEINGKHTVEVDYSGHHVRMLYAKVGLEPPDDPYDLEGFDREIQKLLMLILINTDNRQTAVRAMINKYRLPPIEIFNALIQRHSPISKHFYSGAGLGLMYEDSLIAEQVMLRMMKLGATVLPVHDSFIVRSTYQTELVVVMGEVFTEIYGKSAALKVKVTSYDEAQERKVKDRNYREDEVEFVSTDLELLVKNQIDNYKWYTNIWGL